jgi:signal peptidase I
MAEVSKRKSPWLFFRRQVAPFAFMVLAMLAVRSSLADWNDVPTGSMKPTIIEGDRIFVNKLAYDLKVPFTTFHLARWGDPGRGEIVVFFGPDDGVRLVKRVVAVPGDTIAMENNRLSINGQPLAYGPLADEVRDQIRPEERGRYGYGTEALGTRPHAVISTPGIYSGHRFIAPTTVPPGQYFVMGDNRDNSRDSRYIGLIPRHLIVGRSSRVVLSLDPERYYKPRWGRFFMSMP